MCLVDDGSSSGCHEKERKEVGTLGTSMKLLFLASALVTKRAFCGYGKPEAETTRWLVLEHVNGYEFTCGLTLGT